MYGGHGRVRVAAGHGGGGNMFGLVVQWPQFHSNCVVPALLVADPCSVCPLACQGMSTSSLLSPNYQFGQFGNRRPHHHLNASLTPRTYYVGYYWQTATPALAMGQLPGNALTPRENRYGNVSYGNFDDEKVAHFRRSPPTLVCRLVSRIEGSVS